MEYKDVQELLVGFSSKNMDDLMQFFAENFTTKVIKHIPDYVISMECALRGIR